MGRGRPRYDDILTPREWEVLALLREGLTNDQIADRLGVSYDTAKFHVSEIMGKLGVESRYEAARWRGKPRSTFSLAALLARLDESLVHKVAAVAIGVAVAGFVLLALGVVVMDERSGREESAAAEPTPTTTPESEATTTPSAGEGEVPWPEPTFIQVDRGQALIRQGSYLLDAETMEVWYLGRGGTWAPDGRAVASGYCCLGRGGVLIQEVPTGSVTEVPLLGDVVSAWWSPDSLRLAFVLVTPNTTAPDGERTVHVVNRDGSGSQEVAVTTPSGAGWVDEVTWVSEDALAMAQRSGNDPMRPEFTYTFIDLATGETRELVPGQGGAEDPLVLFGEPSPDGARVAYADGGLYVWDRETGSRTLIDESGFTPKWSPDGTMLLFVISRENPLRIPEWHLYDFRTGERTELADVGLWAQWLPDGQLLHTGWWCNYDPAAPGAIGGIQDVTLQSIDGSEVRRLTNTPDIYETNVSASPTGDVAAFVPREPIRSLELVDLQSGAGETVVEGPADNLHPIYAGSWSSDGRYLQFSFGGGKGLCD